MGLAGLVRGVAGLGLDGPWPARPAPRLWMAMGLAVLKSAGGMHLVMAQGARFAIGAAAMWSLSRVSALRLRAWTPLIYALSMLPLLAVFVLGTGKYGRQWLDLKVFYRRSGLRPTRLRRPPLPRRSRGCPEARRWPGWMRVDEIPARVARVGNGAWSATTPTAPPATAAAAAAACGVAGLQAGPTSSTASSCWAPAMPPAATWSPTAC
ncbi:hypothetical protein NB693_25610 [Pantoea ananatis]|uniref:hypothetical protein n=1 Tax=Pantoea ananas TaxID=553 RepID=UPI00221F6A16|nr:hypothetical protein [Pantoea ananatis]